MRRLHNPFSWLLSVLCVLPFALFVSTSQANSPLDDQLRAIIAEHNLTPLSAPEQDAKQVELGRVLFFDKLLSGNRDISCATCHHPTLGSGDGLPVAIGTGGAGLGPDRVMGEGRILVPRNAPEVFNRGAGWRTMFWDSRITQNPDGSFNSPAGEALPDGLQNVLAVQAMFPVTSRDEMRGLAGDQDVLGNVNELALIADEDEPAIWDGLMQRVLAVPEYRAMFNATYPDVAADDLSFAHAANAIAAFEAAAFTFTDSPWDRYLAGDNLALSDGARRGALVFFGKGGCATCHSGNLFTDQQHHNIAVMQLGPGKGDESPLDLGRFRETGDPADKFAFRTPPLRNVAVSGPYMHNGAFATLEAAVRHHLDPKASLDSYDPAEQLPLAFQETCQQDPLLLSELLSTCDDVEPAEPLTDEEVNDLLLFLEALTDPAVARMEAMIPQTVPSGLPVSDSVQATHTIALPLILR